MIGYSLVLKNEALLETINEKGETLLLKES